MPNSKQRLDVIMVERGLAPSRAKAQAMVMAGEVSVMGNMVDKPGMRFSDSIDITVKQRPPFVSRGGEKLAGALNAFAIPVAGLVCADVGASTGGFTDCLLQNDAARVYAIDVGYGQLAHSLREDPRVVVMERTNARYLESLPEPIQLVVIDASFISLRLLLPPVSGWLSRPADVVTLIKPQFEAGRSDVGKGGVVRDHNIHIRVIQDMLSFTGDHGFQTAGLIQSPLKGPAGNLEFLAWLRWGYQDAGAPYDLQGRLKDLFSAKEE